MSILSDHREITKNDYVMYNQKNTPPNVSRRGIELFFGKVDVGENVIGAETMIAGTFAAVAEVQIGVVRIGAAADSALVDIALLLLLLFDRLFEVDGLLTMLIAAALCEVMHLGIDKHGEVQKGDDRLQDAIPGAVNGIGDNIDADHDHVHDCQPLHLDGQNEEQQDLRIGEQAGKRQEHRQIDVIGAGDDHIMTGEQAGDRYGDQGQQDAAEVV